VSLALVAAVALATAAPPRATLTASPARLALTPGTRRLVHIEAAGTRRLGVEARVAGFALDVRGRPRIVRVDGAASLLSLEPRTLSVGPGGATLAVTARRSPQASAGDHPAIVLLTAAAPGARGVLVRMRLGLVVSVRVPGAFVHRLVVRAARVVRRGKRRRIDVTLVNRGNVIEHVDRAALRIVLVVRGKVVAVLRPERRDLLPRSSGLVAVPCPPHLRGSVVARVELRRTPLVVRRFHLRL
jgi:hypothetical protein